MKTFEQRLKSLEEMVAEIHAHVVLGKECLPGDAARDRALHAFVNGDSTLLDLYIQRGGKPTGSGRQQDGKTADN